MSVIRLAVKVDVDTLLGTRQGVPRLLEMFNGRGLKASFFLSLGPDNSGRAVWRVFTRPGFLAKQIRTRAPSSFGWRTLFLGTLLPAPIIGQGQEKLVRSLIESGHEVGLHAWDHVAWHDRLWRMTGAEIRAEIRRGLEAFTALTGRRPEGFAAPAWRITAPAVEALAEAGLNYLSATRGTGPYRPLFDGRDYGLLELPTTLPTADEVLGRDGVTPDNLDTFFLSRMLKPGLHVMTVHAEMEGRGLAKAMARILDVCLERGVVFPRLVDLARECLSRPEDLPRAEVIRTVLPGRPGRVSSQGA
ncbi:MAG: polysaccharide deacetylase family protein [Thermodesulfobacteriota bacterium]